MKSEDTTIITAEARKQNQALIYIASLQSETSRLAQLSVLEVFARKLGQRTYILLAEFMLRTHGAYSNMADSKL